MNAYVHFECNLLLLSDIMITSKQSLDYKFEWKSKKESRSQKWQSLPVSSKKKVLFSCDPASLFIGEDGLSLKWARPKTGVFRRPSKVLSRAGSVVRLMCRAHIVGRVEVLGRAGCNAE